MNNQKTGNTLNLALDATSREREASMNLNAGYEKDTQRWKLIIRYFGAASELETDEIVITPLQGILFCIKQHIKKICFPSRNVL